ncbi:MAG: DNA recombination protein RmuC [Alphaproteobacteria bacterium]|nr:DNA recombination protein RmuC [Alphaproteobacteria bacterium]
MIQRGLRGFGDGVMVRFGPEGGVSAAAPLHSEVATAQLGSGGGEPLISGPPEFLWIGFASVALVFLLVFFLLLRTRIMGGGESRPTAQERAARADRRAAKAEKKKKPGKAGRQGKAAPPADFFQPAGAGAEITFDDEMAAGVAAPQAERREDHPADVKREAGEAEILLDRGAAAETSDVPGAQAREEAAAPTAQRPGPFAGLFAHKRRDEDAVPDGAREEAPAGAAAPLALRAHPLATERRSAHVEEDERAPGEEIESVQAGPDDKLARKQAERARLEAEEARRRAEAAARAAERELEFERRKLAAAQERREAEFVDRERALAERVAAVQAEAGALRGEIAREFEDRFSALADHVEARLAAAQGESGEAARLIEALAQRMEQGFAELAGRLETQQRAAPLPGAPGEGLAHEGLAQQIARERDEIAAAIRRLSDKIDLMSGAPADLKSFRDELRSLKRALSERASGPTAPAIQLSDLVRNVLPPNAFELRALLANNRRADCLVKLQNPPGPIAIDARFPAEAFDRLHQADESETARAENEFRRTALRHIVDIAERLIVPGETAESALMFLPSESMYAEFHARFPDIVQDSYRARVWIVSPTTLMATLHTIRAVLRDAQSRESADLIHSEAQHVLAEVDALRRRVIALEEDFDKARHDVRDLVSSTDQVYRRAETISNTRRQLAEGVYDRGARKIPPTDKAQEEPSAAAPDEDDGGPDLYEDDRRPEHPLS